MRDNRTLIYSWLIFYYTAEINKHENINNTITGLLPNKQIHNNYRAIIIQSLIN